MRTSIGSAQLQILAVLDKGPSYGAQMLADHPELITTKSAQLRDGTPVMVVDPGALYTKLSRMEKNELIERVKTYKPPKEMQLSAVTRKRAVWYRLTPKGREVLQEHRRSISASRK